MTKLGQEFSSSQTACGAARRIPATEQQPTSRPPRTKWREELTADQKPVSRRDNDVAIVVYVVGVSRYDIAL